MPATRYITVDDVATYLGMDSGDSAVITELTPFIVAAESLVDRFIYGPLTTEDATAKTFSGRNYKNILYTPYYRNLTSVAYVNPLGDELTLNPLVYTVWPDIPKDGLYNGILMRAGEEWGDGELNLKVTADWGCPQSDNPDLVSDVPTPILYALRVICKRLLAERDRPDGVEFRSSFSSSVRYVPDKDFPEIPVPAQRVLMSYRNRWRY
jgi:hypothetical protein